jgi:hypothetical protein
MSNTRKEDENLSNGSDRIIDLISKILPAAAIVASGAAFAACWMFLYGYSVGSGEHVERYFSLSDVIGNKKQFFVAILLIIIFPLITMPVLFQSSNLRFLELSRLPTWLVVLTRTVSILSLSVIFYLVADKWIDTRYTVSAISALFVILFFWVVGR